MTSTNQRNSALEKICRSAIEQRLGDISELPKDLVAHVLKVYSKFITCYLNVLRQSKKKPADWIPDTLSIDSELADGMRHFFSDYQHITRQYYKLNQKIDRLRKIDRESQPNLYQDIIDELLMRLDREAAPGGDHENTG